FVVAHDDGLGAPGDQLGDGDGRMIWPGAVPQFPGKFPAAFDRGADRILQSRFSRSGFAPVLQPAVLVLFVPQLVPATDKRLQFLASEGHWGAPYLLGRMTVSPKALR